MGYSPWDRTLSGYLLDGLIELQIIFRISARQTTPFAKTRDPTILQNSTLEISGANSWTFKSGLGLGIQRDQAPVSWESGGCLAWTL